MRNDMCRLWILVALAGLLGIACSGDPARDDPSRSQRSTATSTTSSGPVDVSAEPSATAARHLPTVASPVAVRGDTGIYFTVADGRQQVVAVDLAERREMWRRPSHQHGRIPGVIFSPFIDTVADRVVVTTYDDETGAVEIAAFELDTGREAWRRPVDWAEYRPRRCAERTLLCIHTGNGLTQLDADGGDFEAIVDGGLARTIGGDGGDLRLSADPGGGEIELGTTVRGGYEMRWRRPLSDFVPAQVARTYGPDGGWTADVDTATGRSLFWLGTLPPDDAYDDPDDEMTTQELRARARSAFLVGVADEAGTPLLGLPEVYDCRDLPFELDAFWTCEDISVVEVEDLDGDGELDPEPVFNRMVRRSAAHLDGDLSVELPSPIPYFGYGIRETSDPNRFLLTPQPRDGDPFVIDIVTGELSPLDDNADLLAGCPLPEEENATTNLLVARMRTFDGQSAEYRTVSGPLGLCTLEGAQVDPADALTRGPLASWFGIAHDVEGADGESSAATTNGWVLWTATDHVLRIANVNQST